MDKLKREMIHALRSNLGRVTRACEICDIAPSTHYSWMKKDTEYAQAVEDIKEAALDYVEAKLFELIDGASYEAMTEAGPVTLKDKPSATAAIFYLKTQGKKRGYVERQELTGPDDQPIQITIHGNI